MYDNGVSGDYPGQRPPGEFDHFRGVGLDSPNSSGYCFAKGTQIQLHDGSYSNIENVTVGTIVNSFRPGSNILHPSRVKRIFRNITSEWMILSSGVIVTPGHHFLNERSEFETIQSIINRKGRIVDHHGNSVSVSAELIAYSESTRESFEQAEYAEFLQDGSSARKPAVRKGWATYNFEVEDSHTYIAGGFRVHNDSIADFEGYSAALSDQRYSTFAADAITNQFGSAALAYAQGPSAVTAHPARLLAW